MTRGNEKDGGLCEGRTTLRSRRKKHGPLKTVLTVLAVISILAVLLVATPVGRYMLSFIVMAPHSMYMEQNSLPHRLGIEVDIPVARARNGEGRVSDPGWYPLMLTYDSGKDFGEYVGEPGTELLVHYTFADFDIWRGCSYMFDRTSPYYSSFYGAYIVTKDGGAGGNFGEASSTTHKGFCFTANGELDYARLATIARYDYIGLVINDMMVGAEEGPDAENIQGTKFAWSIKSKNEGVQLCGYGDWIRVDAEVVTNGAAHRLGKLRASYLQYGIPMGYAQDNSKAFGETTLHCRLYARYFEEKEATIVFYVMTGDMELLEATDRACIGNSKIKIE